MLVDDEHDVVFAFKFVLELNSYEVDGFTDPGLALENFSVGLYDLIIIDVKMPTMSGFELYKLLKKLDNNANICFVTAGEISDEDYHNLPDGADSTRFIRKPIYNKELLDFTALMIKESERQVDYCII